MNKERLINEVAKEAAGYNDDDETLFLSEYGWNPYWMADIVEANGGDVDATEVDAASEKEIDEILSEAWTSSRALHRSSSIIELAKASNKSRTAVYNQAKKLGRLPTLEECKSVKTGRPQKY